MPPVLPGSELMVASELSPKLCEVTVIYAFLSCCILLIPKIAPRNKPIASSVRLICSAGHPRFQIPLSAVISTPIAGKAIAIIQRSASYTF